MATVFGFYQCNTDIGILNGDISVSIYRYLYFLQILISLIQKEISLIEIEISLSEILISVSELQIFLCSTTI